MLNENDYVIQLNRLEICRVMQACTGIIIGMKNEMRNDPECPQYRREHVLPESIAMWQKLHDKIEKQLDILDALNIEA